MEVNKETLIGLGITLMAVKNGFGTEIVQQAGACKQPNVIIILADDMGVGDLSVFNHGQSTTPNLDRLITQGVSYSRAYS